MNRIPKNIIKVDPFGLLSEFPCIIQQPIHWGEMDSFGHLNNVQFLRYFETSRISYMQSLTTYAKHMENGIGPIIYKLDSSFLGQVKFPDTLYVATKIPLDTIRERSYVMKHCMVSSEEQRIVAEATAVIVTYDYRAQKKTKHPQDFLESIFEAEKGDVNMDDWMKEL